MFYSDLSPYQYAQRPGNPATLNVGWLDRKHEYSQDEPSDPFVERLWLFCLAAIYKTMGFHECELCSQPSFGLHVQRGDEELWLGSAEIRVFGREGETYAAPNLIYHYVVDHHYLPPEEFIRAVLEGRLPDSPEYLVRAEQFEWGRKAARERRLKK